MRSSAPGATFPVVVFCTIVIIPFMMMEYVTTDGFTKVEFPVSLFAFLCLSALIFVSLLMPTVRDVRSVTRLRTRPFRFIFRTVLMIAIAVIWVGVVDAQLP